MISANHPRLPKITIVEQGFLIFEESPVPEGIPLVGSSSLHRAAEDKDNLDPSEEDFGAFDQVDPFEDPSGDLGDPDLSEAELLSVGTSSRAEMGLKRKPPTSLLDLLEGQRGRVRREHRSPVFHRHHLSPRPSRLGHPPLSRNHNLPAPNFLLFLNQFCLLGRSPLT